MVVNLSQNKVSRITDPSSMINLFFLLPFLLQPLFTLQVNSFKPVDNFAINCGTAENINYENRSWVGEVDSKVQFGPFEPQNGKPSSSLIVEALDRSTISSVPYLTARLSNLEFTYSFPVSDGQKFVRLHFYPTSYPNFESYNSLFSLKLDNNNFTLLKDFNASLWVPNSEKTFFIEYCINVVTSQRLNLTFFPSINVHPSAYTFINGIEVVSMPPFLYYTNLSDDQGFELVGHDNTPYQIDGNKALETLYRIVVGGNQVPSSSDTGMFRYWDSDFNYIEKQYPYSISTGFGLELNYKNYPDYIAPANVYLTARSYGMNASATANYNVTWNFEVDTEFTYMVRLHFCEFDPEIQNIGDRVFQIFIDDTLAEEHADVIFWSGGNLVPVHKDYAVMFNKGLGRSKKDKLSIKLRRVPKGMSTAYYDVILNGIEIFKISDSERNLAGPNPDPVPSSSSSSSPQPLTHQSSENSNKKTVIVVAVSGLVLVSLMGIIVVFLLRRKRGVDMDAEPEGSSSLPSHLCRYFTIAEIRASTNNFDDVFIIGVGGFGNVYKGYIDGATAVAIKRLKPGSQQGAKEFMNEIEMLSQLRHVNLVSLIGYSNDNAEMILVYDFMHRGTLREYLYGSDNQPLPWKQRLEILLGAARGLHYLHAGAKHNIIHRDVKSTNILLDEKWVAKVSDFGLSKVGPTGVSMTHVSTVVKGSLGYLDPEYYKRQRLTLKSDVYSFGVVLLEVLCARPPLVRNVDKHKTSLVDWVRRCYEKGELDQTVDPFLEGSNSISPECLKSYGELALSCLHDDGNQRPSMSDVVGALEFALHQWVELESEEDNNKFGGTQEEGKSEQKPLFMGDEEGEGSGVRFTSSDESGSNCSKFTTVSASSEEQLAFSALVFSEIGNPRAR